MAHSSHTTCVRPNRNRRVGGACLVVVVLVMGACSGTGSGTTDGIPSLLAPEAAEEVDQVIAQATPTPIPTPMSPVDETQVETAVSPPAAVASAPVVDEDPSSVIPTPAEPKNQPVFRQAQADGDGPDNPTPYTLTDDEPVDIVGELSTFIDRVDVISVEGAPPGQQVLVGWRCIAFASADDRALSVSITGDGLTLGQGRCTEAGQQRVLQVAGPAAGPIVVTFDITPVAGASGGNMFVEYQLVVGGDALGGDTGPFKVPPNDQRAADDGDSRENPRGRDESGVLGGEISGPLGDTSDWVTFEFDEGIDERVRGGISCTDFVTSDGSGMVTATIYRGTDVGLSFVCTPDAPESSRAVRFEPGVTYFLNVEFSGNGFVRWVFETSEL